jgi:NADH-quinone oxidoreductase subunit A
MISETVYGIIILGILASVIGIVMYLGSYIVAIQQGDKEKISPYECGFNPFSDARQEFQVHYYLVAILFMIFDLEVAYLFPWALTINHQGIIGYTTMLVFISILTVGFIYEWCKGALEWE